MLAARECTVACMAVVDSFFVLGLELDISILLSKQPHISGGHVVSPLVVACGPMAYPKWACRA